MINSEERETQPSGNRHCEVYKDSFTRVRLDQRVDNQLFDFQQILKAYNVHKMLRLGNVAVHRDYRRKGFLKSYNSIIREYHQNEYQYLIVVCTTLASQLACKAVNCTLWKEIEYENVLVDGKPFLTDNINKNCACYIKKLNV